MRSRKVDMARTTVQRSDEQESDGDDHTTVLHSAAMHRYAAVLLSFSCTAAFADNEPSDPTPGFAIVKVAADADADVVAYRRIRILGDEMNDPIVNVRELVVGAEAGHLAGTIMLKSGGNDRALRLQESFTGHAPNGRAAHYVFRSRFGSYDSGRFPAVYGNDETVFEANGFEIPSIAITRFPSFSYYTDQDTPDLVSEARLQDTASTVARMLDALERDIVAKSTGKGLVALSHPWYGLYRAAPAPGIDRERYAELNAKWNLLMNCLSRELDGRTTVVEIADRYGLPVAEVHDYVERRIQKGLALDCSSPGRGAC